LSFFYLLRVLGGRDSGLVEVLFHLPGGTKDNREKLGDSGRSGRDSNWVPHEHKSRTLPLHQSARRFVVIVRQYYETHVLVQNRKP
jgi:hypothetical protein